MDFGIVVGAGAGAGCYVIHIQHTDMSKRTKTLTAAAVP